jgi:hypothetical protein
MARDRTIYVSEEEKETLERVARRKFGTDAVADGVVVSALSNDYLDEAEGGD